MLTIGVRAKLIAFLVIGVTITVYIGLRYAGLGRYVGLPGYYVVRLELADGGGIFTDAEVTYRGVTVGRVGPLHLTAGGVEVDLDIDDSVPGCRSTSRRWWPTGRRWGAVRRPAPARRRRPYLAAGSTIAQRDTRLPPRVQNVSSNLDDLASSVPLTDLRTVVDQLYDATAGQGPDLQTLLDAGNTLTTAANDDVPDTVGLIQDSQSVLATQHSESAALSSFGSQAELLARQLASSDADVRRLIANTAPAADQVAGLLRDTSPALGTLLANLVTASTRHRRRH